MNIVNMPGSSPQRRSLYKTSAHYRLLGALVRGSGVVPQQSDCEIACGVADAACLIACIASGPFYPLCASACTAATVICLGQCQGGGGSGGGGGGGGGGTGGPCGCPRGTRCCGGCTKVPGQGLVCNDACIRPGEQCP